MAFLSVRGVGEEPGGAEESQSIQRLLEHHKSMLVILRDVNFTLNKIHTVRKTL